ncbi:alpha/beta hydrolase family protein [Paenibacillus donghaensis]|uniref:Alpha/beta hydrolase n=1 Tax=Paenibacillus donghaensis TaxID=414771 RepID=A0A2Z2KNV1_9BACL|nr:alpha/beta hydrolase [Paenibacillus donghaensis]ASA25350.1 hypothetical protein B9T62_34230 [Paenibacillus donghaensis]
MGMDLEYMPAPAPSPAPVRPRRHRRLLGAMGRRIKATYQYDTALWRTALAGPWVLCFLAFTVAVLGIPTGLGSPADIMLAAAAGTLILAVSGNLLAGLLALLGLRVPRLFVGCLLSDIGAILLILYFADFELGAAAVIAALLGIAGGLAGLALGLLRSRRFSPALLLAAVLIASPLAVASGVQQPDAPPTAATNSPEAALLDAPNPAEPGDYRFRSFTYGSGTDQRRSEYGADAELVSASADASALIKKWPKLRTWFWGFDQSALPVGGRVWMPEGEGPYPLVLMVHGNHMMEDFSDGGYAYLGELLASRGFIAVSLDENFLNYSAWSGIPDNDFKARTWIILKHLEQLAVYSDTPGNPLYQAIDYDRTALLGHSRGGQAVAMAADAERWFKNDPVLTAASRFRISAVVALAPTDKVIDNQQAQLKDVSYLTLQGARDGDVHDFYGDRQYIRSSYSGGSPAFRSSLYIADANHSQFNSDWGSYDQSLPSGLFLSRSRIMDAGEQRQIAKVYVSAFLEATLQGKNEYSSMFRDYRSGLQWLPDTQYFNRYQDGGYRPIAGFDEDRSKTTIQNGTAEAIGVAWTEELAVDRESSSKATHAVLLERTAPPEREAYYSIQLKPNVITDAALSGADGLSFSLANHNLMPDADNEEGSTKESTEENAEASAQEPPIQPSPQVEIELTDRSDLAVRLPLSEVMEVQPLPQTQFTISPWLEERMADGKYGDPSEAVFQTYELPFEQFLQLEPEFDPEQLSEITFYLEGEDDAIMLDDIGFYAR